MRLVKPSLSRLPEFVAALERGWSPDNVRGREAALEALAQAADDARGFVAGQTDREGKGPPFRLPDGSLVTRLPGYQLWLWDDEFCGTIGFRWQPGTSKLPAHVLGHIGYSVVPWKRGRGYATAALRLMLRRVRNEGLRYVEITTDPDNVASQKVVLANGGVLVERFRKPAQYGEKDGLRYRIAL
ncbi:MAG TPA: GNAT family N-acetyltransferase [Casimicrobiaceae bacterium]